MRKLNFIWAFAALFCTVAFVSCRNGENGGGSSVTGVQLSRTEVTMNTGTSLTLHATVEPTGTTDKNVSWSSSDPAIASITSGEVTALTAGTTTITATAKGGKTATCSITVKDAAMDDPNVPIDQVTINPTTATLQAGAKISLSVTISPTNATDQRLEWSTSDDSIAEVMSGTISGIKAGTATITATALDGSKTATCNVTVTEAGSTVAVTGVTLDKTTLALETGHSGTLVATVAPATATDQSVEWGTSNYAVASVSNGSVLAKTAGSATITVTTMDGSKTAVCTVTVTDPAGTDPSEQPFGDITFLTTQTWKPLTSSLTWSDAVMGSDCQKDTFNGGSVDNYQADCRRNKGYGDLFSWAAIDQYGNFLCPSPWRVPTHNDMTALSDVLSSVNLNLLGIQVTLTQWGGLLGGYCDGAGAMTGQSKLGRYWTSDTSSSADSAYDLEIDPLLDLLGLISVGVDIIPNGTQNKAFGMQLRCVK